MLEAHDLECVRGERTLFSQLSLAVAAGDLLRVAGTNGSGKTSLLRMLCGLTSPHAGTVHWRGSSIADLREEFSRELVYLGHSAAVKDGLTAAENLRVACALSGVAASDSQIDAALTEMGLIACLDLPVKVLSQGQRRRAALARLLLCGHVPLWILDEPFTALDVAATEQLRAVIAAQVGRGGMVVLTTHQDAAQLGDAMRTLDLDALGVATGATY